MKHLCKSLNTALILAFLMLPLMYAAAESPQDVDLGAYSSWCSDAQKVMETGENDTLPVDQTVQYEGKDSYRIKFEKLTDWYIILFFVGEEGGQAQFDLTPYKDGYLQMAVKADRNNVKLGTGFKSGLYEEGNEINALLDMEKITTEWQVVSIPIQKFITTYPDFQYAKMNGFEIRGSNGEAGTIWVADMKLTMSKNGSDPTPTEESEESLNQPDPSKTAATTTSGSGIVSTVGSDGDGDGGFPVMTVVYIAIGVAAAALIAVALVYVLRKKK